MRSNVVLVVVAALIIAAALVIHAGFYQFVGTGPDGGYLVHRLTGSMWYVTGTSSQRVLLAPGKFEKGYNK
jgi:hypothetical protein